METLLEEREFEQNDTSKSNYVYTEANSVQNEDPDDQQHDFQRYERDCNQNLRPPKDRLHIVGIKRVNPTNKQFVDSDVEDEEESDSDEDGEDQNEIDLNRQPVEEEPEDTTKIDRSKRLTNKEILSSSSEPSDNAYDNSLEDNGTEDYGEQEPLSTTVTRTNAERSTSINRIPPSLIVNSKRTTDLTGRHNHGIKGRIVKNNTGVSLKKHSNDTRQDVFAELSEAYQALVRAVERFMSSAHRTNKKLNKNGECVTASVGDRTTSEPFSATFNPRTASTMTSQSTTYGKNNDENLLFSDMQCTTEILAAKGESTMRNDTADTEPVQLLQKSNKGDLKASVKKKQHRPFNNEDIASDDVPDQGSMYVYDDYDSVDPNQESADIKHPTRSPNVAVTAEEGSDTVLRKSPRNNIKSDEQVTESQGLDTVGRPEVVKVGNMRPFNTIFSTKVRIRHNRKQKSKGTRKISSIVGKTRSRKKFPEERAVKEESIILPNTYTINPISRTAQYRKDGENQVIELEYV